MTAIKDFARAIGLKVIYFHFRNFILKHRGLKVLDLQQTVTLMTPYIISQFPDNTVMLPEVTNCSDSDKVIFKNTTVVTPPQYVWEYSDYKQNCGISRYGSVIIKGDVLCTDRTTDSFYKDIWKRDDRPIIKASAVIAPFSHFQEETGYWGYFDYVYFVIVKLCRIKDALPNEDFSNMKISYVPFQSDFEIEYLQLLGFNAENLIDSSKYNVISPRIITGNGRSKHPHLADILSLKRHIEKKFKPIKTKSERIYIRRSGRRKIVNEEELIALLKKFNFVIIEDKKMSISEQISIYHNASFIIGPHGASFGNIIWCTPGTMLFELFSPNYAPDFFLYLSELMEMKYAAYYEGEANPEVYFLDGLVEDIQVSIPKLENALRSYLGISD